MASNELPNLVEFCLNIPIYRSFPISRDFVGIGKFLYDDTIRFDTYCIDC